MPPTKIEHPRMRHLPAASRASAPWKNGGGVTREIFVHPAGADFSNFTFRLSLADVAADGPFSVFPGVDRVIGLVSGVGLNLETEGQAPLLLRPSDAPHAFNGDRASFGRLLDGPITDFNVMTRRGAAIARMRKMRADAALPLSSAASFSFLLWQSGAGTLALSDESARPAPLDAFFAQGPAEWWISPDEPCEIWVVEIDLL